ncbi:hypothetical protein SESBI_09510 [Sesbania bispinosa]|nr:hypothetical protein SESBI_09510 [Sesbania bispinosa]
MAFTTLSLLSLLLPPLLHSTSGFIAMALNLELASQKASSLQADPSGHSFSSATTSSPKLSLPIASPPFLLAPTSPPSSRHGWVQDLCFNDSESLFRQCNDDNCNLATAVQWLVVGEWHPWTTK